MQYLWGLLQADLHNKAEYDAVLLRQFSDTGVSHDSAATRLRCGGIVNDDFVAYSLVNLSAKK